MPSPFLGMDPYLEDPAHRPDVHALADALGRDRPLAAGARSVKTLAMPPFDYLVHVSRTYEGSKSKLWPIPLRSPLPAIPIPLKKRDADAVLDLQRVLNTADDRAAYDLTVEYASDPVPPLDLEPSAWAKALLGARGAG